MNKPWTSGLQFSENMILQVLEVLISQDSIDKHYNKMEQSYKSAEEIQRTSEKIKTEMEKAEAALKDMEDKNDKN